MNNFQTVLKSISYHERLNPKVWDNCDSVNNCKLKPKIRERLLDISDAFLNDLEIDLEVDDIILLGSLTNYNWSSYSDFDLHIIVDMSQFGGQVELYKKIFDLEKVKFNDNHNIKIYGYDVELYVQDANEKNASEVSYSLMTDKWIKKPKRDDPQIDRSFLKTKAKDWINKIDSAIKTSEKRNNFNQLKQLKKRLRTYRKSGLEKHGEFSYENLVFKILRRTGHIEKLISNINKMFDKKLSLNT